MRNAAVQNKAFPLAGLMYANVNVRSTAERGENATNIDAYHSPESFETSTRTGLFAPVRARKEGFSDITTRGGNHSTGGSFRRSTRTREGEFSESIKKGSAYRSDHQQENQCYSPHVAAKSVTGRRNPFYLQAIPDAESVFFCIVATAHLSNAGKIRTLSMVALVGRRSRLPVSCKAGIPTPANVTANLSVGTPAVIKYHLQEAAAMLATTPTQNPQFIWLIAAVRRDMPTITAKIHHIAAETEREARRTLARDHVCFFAGRIRLEVAA